MKLLFSFAICFFLSNLNVFSQEVCKNRGDLDVLYCDENYDLVADLPKNSEDFHKMKLLVLSYTPIENTEVYNETFKPFTNYLTTCIGTKVTFFPVNSNAAEVEAMRSKRVQIAGFGSGTTPFAVNIAGAVPFATEGYFNNEAKVGYLAVFVKKDSPYQKLTDLKDKKIAHSSPSANLGHLVPMALFPEEGLIPNKDYEVVFSGKYDSSIMGVLNGDYDAANLDYLTFEQMVKNGYIKEEDFRVIYTSKQKFPSSAWTHSHNLEPEIVEKIKKCFFNYEWSPEIKAALLGADKFVPANYKDNWKSVREIAKKNGISFKKSDVEQNKK